jgi:hypothetical protein
MKISWRPLDFQPELPFGEEIRHGSFDLDVMIVRIGISAAVS